MVSATGPKAQEWLRSRWERALDHFTGTGADRRLLLALSTFASPDGQARPGLAALARRAGCHPSTVARRLPALEQTAWFSRMRGGGRGRTTVYQLTIPETVALKDETVSQGKLSHHGRQTVAPPSEKLSHGRAQREPRTDLNRKNRRAFAEPDRSAASASGADVVTTQVVTARKEPPPWQVAGVAWKDWVGMSSMDRAIRLAQAILGAEVIEDQEAV